MNLADIGLIRLRAQHIVDLNDSTPEDAVRHMLAMQAQDYAGGLWSVGLRTQGSTAADVERAITERRIVRTWPMRGTLHFLHADDVHWMVALLAPRATASARSRRVNQLGLTDTVVDEAETVLRSHLRGGKSIQRGDVASLLKDGVKGIAIDNQHTQHLMRNFGERGIICFGPHAGKQPTFVLLDEWVPPTAPKSRTTALRELAVRYFQSHGPATLKDFSGWGMLTMGDAKLGITEAGNELSVTEIGGTTYYHAPDATMAKKHATLLLPGFDEFLLGYKDRSAVLAPEYADRIVPGGNGMFLAMVVNDGHVHGTWKRTVRKAAVDFSYDMFDVQAPSVRASEDAYTRFILG